MRTALLKKLFELKRELLVVAHHFKLIKYLSANCVVRKKCLVDLYLKNTSGSPMKKSTSQETSVTETKKKTKKKKKSKMNIFKTETAHTTTMPIKTKPVSSVNTFTTFMSSLC
ncbi:hypothetical protein MS3_00007434 [Schistosoma haematobium]|uniref:Uncharacterized protein n=1 Tax=Schistosoma haematobium TaxID=6185 RepID=A0A922IM80_SCHHA|nr:hypothetical protein MS3_00007434 [Schistosoma haematobium]KAH9582802.1 hypothetical protein MS3_00007434 [Schistosoma haematobium]